MNGKYCSSSSQSQPHRLQMMSPVRDGSACIPVFTGFTFAHLEGSGNTLHVFILATMLKLISGLIRMDIIYSSDSRLTGPIRILLHSLHWTRNKSHFNKKQSARGGWEQVAQQLVKATCLSYNSATCTVYKASIPRGQRCIVKHKQFMDLQKFHMREYSCQLPVIDYQARSEALWKNTKRPADPAKLKAY